MLKNIFFIGDSRDFHAMDWYRNAQDICHPRKVYFATDLMDCEGRPVLIKEGDHKVDLFNIDGLLLSRQSHFGNFWRNLIKVLVAPLQVGRIKSISRENPDATFHAHTMYYMFLCWAAKIKFIGTPQGSDVLERPDRSNLYKYFATKALAAATHVTVDSINMQNKIFQLCGKKAAIIQNGIDINAISQIVGKGDKRSHIVSIRGLYPLYRIEQILKARHHCLSQPPLAFFYPFWEDGYKEMITGQLRPDDVNLGRIPSKIDVYKFLANSKLAISIPESDSSPRSVYEAIFCGCCVAVTYNAWIEALPECMKSRLFIVNLEDDLWLHKAIEHADSVTANPYIPSETALNLFDERKSMKIIADQFY